MNNSPPTGEVPQVIFECVGRPGILQCMIDVAERDTRLASVGSGVAPVAVRLIAINPARAKHISYFVFMLVLLCLCIKLEKYMQRHSQDCRRIYARQSPVRQLRI